MNKNKLMRMACALLVVTLLSTCVISGTFAKYVSQTNGDDSVVVAKWSIVYSENGQEEGTQIAVSSKASKPEVDFNLFNTILDSNGQAETDVVANKIAPGTKGSFSFTIQNASEVTAAVSVAVTETNSSNIPLVFTMGETTADSLEELLKDLGTIAMNTTKTYTVQWEWPFERKNGDASDTDLGIMACDTNKAPKYDVAATITVVQVD